MRAGVLTLLMWAACCLCARADAGVVLRENNLRPGLCAALTIQLSGEGQVRCERDTGSDVLSERIARTSERVRMLDVRLGVLLEHDPDPKRLRMYLVSAQSDQAVIAIERIEDRPEPDVDRSLALKVRDAYEVVAVVKAAAPEKTVPLAATLATTPSTSPAGPATTPAGPPGSKAEPMLAGPTVGLLLDAGGGLSIGSELHAGAAFALGGVRIDGHLRLEAMAGVRIESRHETRRPWGHVNLLERAALVSLRALWHSDRVELGGVLDAIGWLFRAQGTALDGSRGTSSRFAPAVGVGVDFRVHLFAIAHLRFAPMVELFAVRQRFAVDERVVSDEGRVRVVLPVSLIVALPLHSGAEVQP